MCIVTAPPPPPAKNPEISPDGVGLVVAPIPIPCSGVMYLVFDLARVVLTVHRKIDWCILFLFHLRQTVLLHGLLLQVVRLISVRVFATWTRT